MSKLLNIKQQQAFLPNRITLQGEAIKCSPVQHVIHRGYTEFLDYTLSD